MASEAAAGTAEAPAGVQARTQAEVAKQAQTGVLAWGVHGGAVQARHSVAAAATTGERRARVGLRGYAGAPQMPRASAWGRMPCTAQKGSSRPSVVPSQSQAGVTAQAVAVGPCFCCHSCDSLQAALVRVALVPAALVHVALVRAALVRADLVC